MALATYSDLKTALGTWKKNRTDLPAADLVTLAEARLARDLELRVVETDASLTGTIGARTIALPAGFLEPLALFIVRDTGREELTFVPSTMDTSDDNAEPEFWTVDGSNVAFDCPCAEAYSFLLKHNAKLALSDASTTNWLLTNHPDVYLAACNVEAAMWLEDDAQAARWQARYEDAKTSINNQEHRSRAMTKLRTDPALTHRGGSYDINTDR